MAHDLYAHVKDVNSPRIRKVYINTYATLGKAQAAANKISEQGALVWNTEDFPNPMGFMPRQVVAFEVIET